jgi:hypothetical protein
MDIRVKCDRPGYPLGRNMKGAMKTIDAYIAAFSKLGYDTHKGINLWCRGSSGAILAGMFAVKCQYECKICHIKKDNESSHSGNWQSYDDRNINVIIDDFVSFGHTLMAIVAHIENINREHAEQLTFDVLMILDWENAPETTVDQFTHRIGTRIH